MTTPPLWMPGALRIESSRRVALNGNGFRLLTWHTFETSYTLSVKNALNYLIQNGSEAFVFHPITGEWGQCQPMNTGARTLRSAPDVPTNKFGTVHQQVEVIARAANPWTSDLTDAGREGLRRGLDFFRAWGIPDQWAWKNQPPPRYPGGSVRRRLPEQSGHAYHSGWPANDHGDPGAIRAPWLAAPSKPNPSPPTGSWFDMATAEELRKIVREEINSKLDNPETWRRAFTGMEFFKDPTTPNRGESPDEQRIPLGRLMEIAGIAALEAKDVPQESIRAAVADAIKAIDVTVRTDTQGEKS